MHETVAAKRDEVATLCREVRVRRLDVFGSAVGGQFDPDTSDVDVVVDFAGAIDFDRFFALKEGLEAIFDALSTSFWLLAWLTPTSGNRSSRLESCSMPRDPRTYLWDAPRAVELICQFVDGKLFADYETDTLLSSAVERQLKSSVNR